MDENRQRKHRSLVVVGLLVGAVASVLVGCSSGAQQPSQTATGSQSSVVTTPVEPELPHIHGAGFDAATGAVFAGTHDGVWQVTSTGAASAVGSSRDDLMGFMIAAPDSWYSSGHPGAGSAAANPLGLIRSTDKGRTWKEVSLGGEVDFHALAARGTTVVGFAGGQTVQISSTSGATWRDGASIQVSSLAFAGDAIVAASPDGVQRSTDAGASFVPVQSASKLVLLSAGAAGSVWGVDTTGVAWSSADAGLTWTRRASVGVVQALAAVDATTSYAITPTSLIAIR